MDSKYLSFELEELLDDKQFVAWILKGHKNKEWSSFINNHPEIQSRTKKAREIISLLKDTYDILDEEDILLMWQNIDQFNKSHKSKVRTLKLRRSFSVAASILIIVSLGILSYSYLNNKNTQYQFASSDITDNLEESRLILSDGEQIALNKDESTVSLDNDKVVINNENTIDLSGRKPSNDKKVQMNEVVVPYGKRTELLLADGTKVWLNAGSRLAFPTKFTNETREVYLTGEGCFKVTKNESQPFIVNANDLGIKVLGTHFNVAAYPDDESIETILVEGSVELSKRKTFGLSSKSVLLKPMQKATFSKDEKEIFVTDEPDADVYIAWTEGWFTFSQQTLEQVFTKLERFYNVDIIVAQNFPSNEKITGKLDLKDSLEEVLKVLSDVAKINYRITNNQVFVDKKVKEIPMK
ncbi:FecR domain-containing protein [uncultured Draconibacterium sp.]|uniref:FecR family protein n=1 Tax=uncultured Draconibacterium sp. TaxID=1573823 RepID=UPI0029C9338D|nr:FecR domain-containing protein [uncultured Draconibacterium sp.]